MQHYKVQHKSDMPSAGHHSESGVIPMLTADKLENLARYKLLPLKQKTILQKPKIIKDSLMLPLN